MHVAVCLCCGFAIGARCRQQSCLESRVHGISDARALHERDEGRIAFKYDAFIKYVNQLIRNTEPLARPTAPAAPTTATPAPKAATRSASNTPAPVPAATPKPAAAAVPASPASEQAGKIPSFNFNPTPYKEDLL